jgi:hypothetical protein
MFCHRATRLGSLCACLAVIRDAGEQGRADVLHVLEASYRAWWLFLLLITTARRVAGQRNKPAGTGTTPPDRLCVPNSYADSRKLELSTQERKPYKTIATKEPAGR